jgi:hypothetical protein
MGMFRNRRSILLVFAILVVGATASTWFYRTYSHRSAIIGVWMVDYEKDDQLHLSGMEFVESANGIECADYPWSRIERVSAFSSSYLWDFQGLAVVRIEVVSRDCLHLTDIQSGKSWNAHRYKEK